MKTSLDNRLSDLLLAHLRQLTRNRCEECRKLVFGKASQTSHGFTRARKGIKWDRLNVLHLCAGCHFAYGDKPPLAEQFLTKHLGEAGYAELCRRERTIIKTTWLDYEKIKDYIAQLQLGKYPLVSPTPLWEL